MIKKAENRTNDSSGRLGTPDLLRGLTLVSMIFYHGMWDFLYLSDRGTAMRFLRALYEGAPGHLWQQSICRTFILLSGFCVPFSRHIFRRGLEVSACGAAVTLVTVLAMYEERVVFGVLTFLGAAMLLTGALRKAAGEISFPAELPAAAGLTVCAGLFHMCRWVNRGYLQLWGTLRVSLPAVLYGEGPAPGLRTFLGFMGKGFFSTDYFSLLPWIFLFWTGVFLHRLMAARCLFRHPLFHLEVPLLNRMGRHSLLIYMLHQPVLYLLLMLFQKLSFYR